MTIVVPAAKHHVEALAELMAEMDHFYGDTAGPSNARINQITDVLFGDPPAAYALLAVHNDRLVGMAAYSFLWPAAGVSLSLYLKELYVAESHRRTGVGRLLMQSIFQVARERECGRVEWATDDANSDAQKFYDLLGYSRQQGKVFYRITDY